MSDHSKPIGNPPPTDIEGEQSGPEHKRLTFSDILEGCKEVQIILQRAEELVALLKREYEDNVSQLSDKDTQELIGMFDRVIVQSGSLAYGIKLNRPLPSRILTDHSSSSTAATYTDDLSPKVNIPNSGSSTSGDLGVEETNKSDGVEQKSPDVTNSLADMSFLESASEHQEHGIDTSLLSQDTTVIEEEVDIQQLYMKTLHHVSLPYLLSAVEDVRKGLREPQKAHFNAPIVEFMQFVKKAKNDKKKKKGFADFNPIEFIQQQYEKHRDTKKNHLFYDTLGQFLSEGMYERAIHELLYYFSEKKFDEPEPESNPIANVMQGVEHHFFYHLLRWVTAFWKQALEDYVKRQEASLRNMKSKVLPNRYTRGRKLPKFRDSEFFNERSAFHSSTITTSPAMWFLQRAYGILSTVRVESQILDSDFEYLKTNYTEDEGIQLEYEVLSEIFSTDDESFVF